MGDTENLYKFAPYLIQNRGQRYKFCKAIMLQSSKIEFITSLGHHLTIENNTVTVINKFGDCYRCEINESGKLVAKGRLSLAVCMRAMNEYRNNINL